MVLDALHDSRFDQNGIENVEVLGDSELLLTAIIAAGHHLGCAIGSDILAWQVEPAAIGKGLIAAMIAGAMALGILTLFVLTPLYTAKISILLDPKRDAALDIGLALSGMAVDVGFIESEVSVIGSFNTARRVVEKLERP
jgi:hypothetical protein